MKEAWNTLNGEGPTTTLTMEKILLAANPDTESNDNYRYLSKVTSNHNISSTCYSLEKTSRKLKDLPTKATSITMELLL